MAIKGNLPNGKMSRHQLNATHYYPSFEARPDSGLFRERESPPVGFRLKLRLGRENAVMLPPLIHRSLHRSRVFGNALCIGIAFCFILHLLLLQIQLLTQLIHIPDLFLPGLLLIRIHAIHQAFMFLFHLPDLIPHMGLLLSELTLVQHLSGILAHLPRLFADFICQFVAGSNLIPLLFGGLNALVLYLSVGGLAATLALPLAHYLSLTLTLNPALSLSLTLSSTAAFSSAFPLRESGRQQKQNYRQCH